MLADTLGSGSGIAPIKRLIIEKAGRNPFFMEEMAGDLFDRGVLLRGREIEVTQPISEIRVPASVKSFWRHASIACRRMRKAYCRYFR